MPSYDNLPCGTCGGCNSCIECVGVAVATVSGETTTEQPLFEVTVPGGTWKDGEMFVIDYALQVTIQGGPLNPFTHFAPSVIVQGVSQFISGFYFHGGTYLQLYRMIFRRIGANLAIYDGDRAQYKTVAAAFPDVIGFNSVFQSQFGAGNTGAADFQSATGAYAALPDFTADIVLSLAVTPDGGGPDTIEALSPAGYKYTVPQ